MSQQPASNTHRHSPHTDKPHRATVFQDEPRILKFDPQAARKPKKWSDEETLGQFIPLIYHYNMLQDEDRVGAFKEAIELLVKPGMRVLELGSGTGILSSLAARQGAQVYAVERNPELVECSSRFVHENGLADRIKIIASDAATWLPPEPVDVVICEMLHVGLLREKQTDVIAAFKRNYAAQFGSRLPIFIPEVSILMCQPVYQDFMFAGYRAAVPMFQSPMLNQARTQPLSELQTYHTVQYDQPIPTGFNATLNFKADVSGEVNAMRLITQNVLTIDLPQQKAVTWANQCLILPAASSLCVFQGDELTLSMQYECGRPIESVRFDFATAALQRFKAA